MKRYLQNSVLTALVVLTGVTLLPAAASTQEASACFMIDGNGNVIELGNLCGNATRNTPRVLQVPIKRREGGTPVIDVTFNGRQTFEMLFDTGASHTAITPQMAKALGVVQDGAALFETAGGRLKHRWGGLYL